MSQMRLKMMDGRKENNMRYTKCECGTVLSDCNVQTHYKKVETLEENQLGMFGLTFRPLIKEKYDYIAS